MQGTWLYVLADQQPLPGTVFRQGETHWECLQRESLSSVPSCVTRLQCPEPMKGLDAEGIANHTSIYLGKTVRDK